MPWGGGGGGGGAGLLGGTKIGGVRKQGTVLARKNILHVHACFVMYTHDRGTYSQG